MDYREWVFITDGRAIVVEALSIKSATEHYMEKYTMTKKPLHIVEITEHSVVRKSIFTRRKKVE